MERVSVSPEEERPVRIIFGGDVMLGRVVRPFIELHGPGYPLEPIAALMREADLTVVNLECAITKHTERWRGEEKAFYFGAPPQAATTLARAGVDMVSLANNHTLDFGVAGLFDTMHQLRKRSIKWTGAGQHLAAACMPAIAERRGIRIGMAAFCDHQADFAAGPQQPGIAYLDLYHEESALAALHQELQQMRRAGVDWPILSLHWGPNMTFRPAPHSRHLAHAAIDMGWKVLFGHSAHVFNGIEIYRGCPIIYAAGDVIDDYRIDPAFRNDHQLLIEIGVVHQSLSHIRLYPIVIMNCRAWPAAGKQFDEIAGRMAALCMEFGTRVMRNGHDLWIDLGDA